MFHANLAAPLTSPAGSAPGSTPPHSQRPTRRRHRLHRLAVRSDGRAQAVLAERTRLGRELHDGLGQTLACATAYTGAASDMLAAGDVESANWAVQQAARALDQAYRDLREAICALRAGDVDPAGWAAGLHSYAAFYQQQWGIRCDLALDEAAIAACSPETRTALTRILQEALNNIRKHAHTDHAAIRLSLADGRMVAEVCDYGVGFDPARRAAGHYGLDTMQERARALGGDLTVTSAAGGTRLLVRLPARTSR